MKPGKQAKIISQIPICTNLSQPKLVTNPPIRKGMREAGLRRKVPGIQQVL